MKVISELFVPLSWPWVKTLCEISSPADPWLGPLGDFLTVLHSAIIVSYFFPFFPSAEYVNSKPCKLTENVQTFVSDILKKRELVEWVVYLDIITS